MHSLSVRTRCGVCLPTGCSICPAYNVFCLSLVCIVCRGSPPIVLYALHSPLSVLLEISFPLWAMMVERVKVCIISPCHALWDGSSGVKHWRVARTIKHRYI